MEKIKESYCRLCAATKPPRKLINLEDKSSKSLETLVKISRLNLAFLNIFEENLPKTVCFVCLTSLDRAVEFVQSIEKAQILLRDVFVKKLIKKESVVTDNSNLLDLEPKDDEQIGIKFEVEVEPYDVSANDSSDSDEPLLKLEKVKKKSMKDDLINIPFPLNNSRSEWRDFAWTCAVCEVQYTTLSELTTHSMEIHKKCTAYKCPESGCHVKKLRHDTFISHMKRHTESLKMSCHICFKHFPFGRVPKSHFKEHTEYEHICPGCNASFQTEDELNTHMERYYTDARANRLLTTKKEDKLTCKHCNKSFTTTSNLKFHLKLHEDRPKDHVCDKCGKGFYDKHSLASHLLVHTDLRPHKCKICSHGFRNISQLRSHIGTHEGIKPFCCNECGKCFRLEKQLRSHSIIHTDQIPYVCSYCNKGFKFKTPLNAHLRQHTGEKPYSCGICERAFTNWPNYNKHMKQRHNMNMARRKHTPDGLFPVNPTTGEVQVIPLTSETEEWKKRVFLKRAEKKALGLSSKTSVLEDLEVKN